MAEIKLKRDKLHEMVANIHDEAEEKREIFLAAKDRL